MKTKFELLEHVQHKISGTFENEAVAVIKTLVVCGVIVRRNERVTYQCFENYDLDRGPSGKQYDVDETLLIAVEPVVKAIAGARAAESSS